MGIHSDNAVKEALTVMRELSDFLKRVHDQEDDETASEVLFLSDALLRLSRQRWSCRDADQSNGVSAPAH